MNCTFRNDLSPYLDGELDRVKEEEMKTHLKACSACQGELDFLLEIRESLKETAALTKAPTLLKERILGELRPARRIVFIPRWNFAYGAILVAVLLTFVLISSHLLTRKESFSDIATLLVKYHNIYSSGEKALSLGFSDPQEAKQWLEKRFGLNVLIPKAAFAGYNLKGGDIFEQGGREFAYLNYQGEGNRIGYVFLKDSGLSLNFPENTEIGGIQINLGTKNGVNLAAWKRNRIIYVILTTGDRSEIIEYVERCIRLFENEMSGSLEDS